MMLIFLFRIDSKLPTPLKKESTTMKKKLLILTTFTLLSSQLQASCSKTEVLKLVDKNFSKNEISSICNIDTEGVTSPASSYSTPQKEWFDFSSKQCVENKGKLDTDGFCHADWHSAISICHSTGGRLPTISELRSVVTECGGEIDANNVANNLTYQLCYRVKGFVGSNVYWSSTERGSSGDSVWVVKFITGTDFGRNKSKIRWSDNSNTSYVRCTNAEL